MEHYIGGPEARDKAANAFGKNEDGSINIFENSGDAGWALALVPTNGYQSIDNHSRSYGNIDLRLDLNGLLISAIEKGRNCLLHVVPVFTMVLSFIRRVYGC